MKKINELSDEELIELRHSEDKIIRMRACIALIRRATENPDKEKYLMGFYPGYNTILQS